MNFRKLMALGIIIFNLSMPHLVLAQSISPELYQAARIANQIKEAKAQEAMVSERAVQEIVNVIIFFVIAYFAIRYYRKYQNKPKLGVPHPDTHVKCPDCKEFVLKEATVCKHCGCKLIPQ